MRTLLCFSTLALLFALPACGGNVSISGSSSGGSGGEGGTSGTTTSGTTTSTTADFYACTGPGQCVLAVPACCSGCGIQEASAFEAVNGAQADAYFKHVCPEPTPCPACESQPNPNVFAYCDAGKCAVADVRAHPVSECGTDADCHLRNGAGCCETCGVDQNVVIAVSYLVQDLQSLTCTPDAGCPKCLPQYPEGWTAVCTEMAHCAINPAPPSP